MREKMRFGEFVEGLGARLGAEIEDAGDAAAFEIDGETAAAWKRLAAEPSAAPGSAASGDLAPGGFMPV